MKILIREGGSSYTETFASGGNGGKIDVGTIITVTE